MLLKNRMLCLRSGRSLEELPRCVTLQTDIRRCQHFVSNSISITTGAHLELTDRQDRIVELRLGMKQNAFDELEQRLYQVSDPDHEHYGRHLSTADIHNYITPHEDALNSIHEWLEENDVRLDTISYSSAKDWVVVNLPVSEVEKLLDTEYHVYKHFETGTEVSPPCFSVNIAIIAQLNNG